jgi:hypothetical protein
VSDFKEIQQQFVSWLRQPEQHSMPDGIEARRMAVYRRLVRNTIYSFLSAGFPVLKKLLKSSQWTQLVDDFVASHAAKSPYFSDMGREFVDFLALYCSDANPRCNELPVYTYELASYERMEVDAQFAMLDERYQQVAAEQAVNVVAHHRWWLNDSVQLAQFHYPVAWLGVDQQGEPLPVPQVNSSGYLLMVYRPPWQSSTQFLQLEPLTALVISSLQQHAEPQSLAALQGQLKQLLPHWDSTLVDDGVAQLCINFIQQGVLLRAP